MTVAGAPADLVVTLDDAPLAPGTIGKEQPIDPGVHRVHAEATGRKPQDQTFTAVERGRARVDLELLPSALPAPPPPPPSRLPGALVTAGGAAVLVASVAALAASYVKDAAIDAQCHGAGRTLCPISHQAQILSDVRTANALRFSGVALGVAGAGGLAAGVYLLVKKPRPSTGGQFRVVPAVGPGGAQATIVGRF